MKASLHLFLGLVLGLAVGSLLLYGWYQPRINGYEARNVELVNETQAVRLQYSELQAKYENLSRMGNLTKEPATAIVSPTRSNVKVIDINATQWAFKPNIIEVNRGDIVMLRISSSTDKEPSYKEHGFSIPDYNIETSLPAGRVTTVVFVADKAGEFYFGCSVVCGTGHYDMFGKLIVRS
ncbi:MAG: cupredoxin domain-containing protein [Thaumarchaeota archaeon]|nr:cupredoxin domain-containing protein [Nitrososphaerota archaeon]